jgi:hypothetical protein
VRAISRLFEPPRLRTLRADEDDDRRALALIPLGLSPLTTIFVLVTILVAQVGYELARHGGHTHEASV